MLFSKIINRKIENNTRIKKGKKGKNTHKKEAQNREAIRELKQREKERNRKSLEELELVFNREFTTGHLIPKNNPKINLVKSSFIIIFMSTMQRPVKFISP